jgi:hypothetical protein
MTKMTSTTTKTRKRSNSPRTRVSAKKARNSFYGVLGPRCSKEVIIEPCALPDEQPIIFSAHPGEIFINEFTPNRITIENTTDQFVPYVIVLVPQSLIKLGSVPWRKLTSDLLSAARTSPLLQGLGQAFNHLVRKKR